MKRKPVVNKQPIKREEIPTPVEVCAPSMGDRLFPYFFPVLLFFAMTVQTAPMSVFLAALALLFSIGKIPLRRFLSRLSIPVWGFLIFLVLNLAGSLYSNFGSYAFIEFSKIVASGSLGILLLSRGRKEDVRGLLLGFTAVCGLIALLSLGRAYGGTLFQGFSKLMAALGETTYQELLVETDVGARLNGIYNNANLMGSLLALALLVGIYLLQTSEKRWERLVVSLLTGISAVDFLAGASRGAMLVLGLSGIIYLLLVGRGNRVSWFFTALSVLLGMVLGGGLSIWYFLRERSFSIWTILMAGLVIFAVREGIPVKKLEVFIARRGRWMKGALVTVALVCVAAVALALTLKKPIVFQNGNVVYRGVEVVSGETYRVEGDFDKTAGIKVEISGYTREQEILNEKEVYYGGLLSEAEFTVPEGVDQVFFYMYGPDGSEIRSLSLSDGTPITMAYRLLPETLVSRFQQNLFEDASFLMRVQYVKDGWALFRQAPLLGHGLGATEGLLTSVQTFYYESKYVHNDLMQILDETGLFGLVSFLALMLGSGWLVWKRPRQESRVLAAALLTCLVMMNLHGLMEITFSVRMYQCAAYVLTCLAIISAEAPAEKRSNRAVGVLAVSVAGVWLLLSGGLLGSSLMAQKEAAALDTTGMDVEEFMGIMERLDAMDFYCDQAYKVNLMGNALQLGGSQRMNQATILARELSETGEFDACYQAAAYYYLPLRNMTKFFDVVQTGLMQERSNADAWNSACNLFIQAFAQLSVEDMEDFAEGMVEFQEFLDETNQRQIQPITLSEENSQFLNTVVSGVEAGLEPDLLYTLLQEMQGSTPVE